MSKTKMLNKWQRHNLEILCPITLATLKSGDWRNTPSSILYCVKCGQHKITTPILKYFGYMGERVLCYDCQRLTKAKQYSATGVLVGQQV